jgi:hypothetical protein
MDTCVGDRIAANELMTDVDTDMVLLTKERLAVLLGPAGVRIFLPALRFVP